METMQLNTYKQYLLEQTKKLFEEKLDQKLKIIIDSEHTNQFILTGSWFYLFIPISDEVIDVESTEYTIDGKISFEVNTTIALVAETVRLLNYIFRPYDFTIAEDYFLDDAKEIYYGDEAYTKVIDSLHEKNGEEYCPCCNKYISKKLMNTETGICKICEEFIIPKVTFH